MREILTSLLENRMPDANGWIKDRLPTDDEIEAGIEAWRYVWEGRKCSPIFYFDRKFIEDFRGQRYNAWRPFIPPECEHAKCTCNAPVRMIHDLASRTVFICCQYSTCWKGPRMRSEREAWEAWDALMRKAAT